MFQRCNAVAAFEVEAGQWRAQRAVAPLVAEHGFVDFEEGVQQPALLEDGDLFHSGNPFILNETIQSEQIKTRLG